MRYEFVGRKTENVGKTLWEIVGNLKNFGVGRLLKTSDANKYPETSFFKIIRIQPLPPSKRKFEDRSVRVWIDVFFRGRHRGIEMIKKCNMAKYQLIPKVEEEKYLKAAEIEPPPIFIHKYCSWPPLYKKLWERENQGAEIPKMKRLVLDSEESDFTEIDEELPPSKSSLHKGKLSVHEMYLEIVRLKKLIKDHENTQK